MGAMTRRHFTLFAIAAFVGVSALSVAWLMLGKSELERKLELVEVGMTQSDARALLGEPSYKIFFNTPQLGEVGLCWREPNGARATVWFDGNGVVAKEWTPSKESPLDTLRRWMRRDE